MEKPKLYRFKWNNYDLKYYLSNLRQRASNLRGEAQLLVARAKEIDEMADNLSNDLIEPSEEK